MQEGRVAEWLPSMYLGDAPMWPFPAQLRLLPSVLTVQRVVWTRGDRHAAKRQLRPRAQSCDPPAPVQSDAGCFGLYQGVQNIHTTQVLRRDPLCVHTQQPAWRLANSSIAVSLQSRDGSQGAGSSSLSRGATRCAQECVLPGAWCPRPAHVSTPWLIHMHPTHASVLQRFVVTLLLSKQCTRRSAACLM